MNESSRYAVGIDVGTVTVRCVVGHFDGTSAVPTIVGVGTAPNSGMRKGTVVNLQGPSQAIDQALGEAERMSGYEVNEAMISINGAHILSTKADGMIAVGGAGHEINDDDVARVEEVATVGKIPANREVLEVVPHAFRLDGQDNIKDPVGMTGTRLELSANVISGLTPHVTNLRKASEMATVEPHGTIVSVLASARAVLGERQLESGVAVIDMGAATTGIAVFEEGDLHYVGVVPMGGMHVTNDLAIGLKTDPEIAEEVKLKHANAVPRHESSGVSVKHGDEIMSFQTNEIDEIVDARLEEIFEAVQKELASAGRAGQLPSGVVLVGGASQMPGMTEYAKTKLGLAARAGKPSGFSGVSEQAEKPEFAAAVGLMLLDEGAVTTTRTSGGQGKASQLSGTAIQSVKNLFGKFKA